MSNNARKEPFVSTWVELSKRLEVSRRMIQEWRKDPRYAGKCPRPASDGRHDVEAWILFMLKHGLKGSDEGAVSEPEDEEDHVPGAIRPPVIGGTEADWKRAERMLRVKRLQRDIEILEATLLVAAELELPLGATFVAITNKLTQFPERLGPQVVGFSSVQEVIEIIRAEVEADLQDLNAAEYLAAAPAEVAQALPFDEETARLMDQVSFAGQDRAALLELIERCVVEALRRVGRRAIERTKGAADPLNAATGQVSDDAAEAAGVARNSAGKPKEKRSRKLKKRAKARGKADDDRPIEE